MVKKYLFYALSLLLVFSFSSRIAAKAEIKKSLNNNDEVAQVQEMMRLAQAAGMTDQEIKDTLSKVHAEIFPGGHFLLTGFLTLTTAALVALLSVYITASLSNNDSESLTNANTSESSVG